MRTLLSKLIWKSSWIEEWLMEEAERALKQWEAQGVTPIAAWDGSVLEKPESRSWRGWLRCAKASPSACNALGQGSSISQVGPLWYEAGSGPPCCCVA